MKKPNKQPFEKFRGQVHEAMMEALSTIRTNKMRSTLVIIGVMIGVASLMGMVSTLSGLSDYIDDSLTGGNKALLALSKVDITKGEGTRVWLKRKNFKVEDAEAISKLRYVKGVMIAFARDMVVKYKDRKANLIRVVGSNQELKMIHNINLVEGRYFTQDEQNRGRKKVVLGNKPRYSLFPDEDPLEKQIRINGKEYEVIGVFEKQKSIFGGLVENFVVIPYPAYERDFLQSWEGPELRIIIDNPSHLDEAEDDIRALMRMRRKVPLSEPDDFALFPIDAIVQFTKSLTDQVALVLVVLASIALMVGGVGVMVIMLVSVTERTHEIGIRKAIGATRGQITTQFLIEAATLSGIGGAIGILCGLGISLLLSLLIGFPFQIPIGWTIFSVAISAGIGLFFGIFPAHKAARLDPVVALRYE
jgi:putative ABC transport system permease protein